MEGGFGQARQFPHETWLLFLLDRVQRDGDARALAMVTRTLDAIAAGALHDQIGGGFHRYTVDPGWDTPHFEKMLYNQALLARAFVASWQITGRAAHARAARRALDYVLRDMTAPDGAFHTAEDADSRDADGRVREGAFYAWTPAEVHAALGDADGDWAVTTLGLDGPGAIEAGPVPRLPAFEPVDPVRLDRVVDALRAIRAARPRPLRDDKIIAGWNGLMIRALAEAGRVLGEPRYVDAAARAANAVVERLCRGSICDACTQAGARAATPP